MKRPTYEALEGIAKIIYSLGVVHKIMVGPDADGWMATVCGIGIGKRYSEPIKYVSLHADGVAWEFCPECWSENEIEETP